MHQVDDNHDTVVVCADDIVLRRVNMGGMVLRGIEFSVLEW